MEKYSFCIFRIPHNGGRVLWEITNTCNYRCKYCMFSSENKKESGEMSTSEIFKTLEELKCNNFTHIKFTGGEPFTREEMVEILRKASDLGFSMDISTNASLITKEKAKQIKNTNIKMVHVSLDGHNTYTHELVRGINTFDRTIGGIKNLVENEIYVRIGTVLYSENDHNIKEIIELAIELKVNEIIFSFMEAAGRMKGDNSLLSVRSISEVKKEIEELRKAYKEKIVVNFSFTEEVKPCEDGKCPGLRKFLYINNLGKVSPCSWASEEDKSYTSEKTLKESTYEEIMKTLPIQSYLEYVDQLYKNNIKGCPFRRRVN